MIGDRATRLPLHLVGLARPRWWARCHSSTRFGFSWNVPFRCENPGFWGLYFLGFPWILSPETRLINRLRDIFAQQFFVALSPPRTSRRNGGPTIRYTTRTDCSSSKLTSTSDFLQEIAA